MCEFQQGEGETQRAFVRRMLLTQGWVSAHDLTYRHGITRTAAIIFDLRAEGMVIDTNGKPGHQATYHVSPLRDDAAAALPWWKCLTCGTRSQSSASALLAGYAEHFCLTCASKRLHKRDG